MAEGKFYGGQLFYDVELAFVGELVNEHGRLGAILHEWSGYVVKIITESDVRKQL